MPQYIKNLVIHGTSNDDGQRLNALNGPTPINVNDGQSNAVYRYLWLVPEYTSNIDEARIGWRLTYTNKSRDQQPLYTNHSGEYAMRFCYLDAVPNAEKQAVRHVYLTANRPQVSDPSDFRTFFVNLNAKRDGAPLYLVWRTENPPNEIEVHEDIAC